MKYICVSPSKEVFDYKGKSLGMEGKRVLCYSSDIGKHRIYRQFLNHEEKGMKIFKYKRLSNAQKLCDLINEAYNDNFSPVLEGEKNV